LDNVNSIFYKSNMLTPTVSTGPAPAPPGTLAGWWAFGPGRVSQTGPEDGNLWMSEDEMAIAWALSLLTAVALAALIGLALLG
jgi:hypothetical protein